MEVLFSEKKIPIDHPPILFNHIPVVKVDIYNHLGMVIDSRLKSSSHTYGGPSLSLHFLHDTLEIIMYQNNFTFHFVLI